MSKDSYYFSHDSNACMDPKMLKLRMKYGWEGYGIFWAIIESLRNEENYMMSSEDIESLTLSLAIDLAKLKQILSKCLEVGLLVEFEGNIYSESLLRRMEKADIIRGKRAEAGRKGGKAKAIATTLLKQTPSKTVALKESKVKESKESKEDKRENKESFSIDLFSDFRNLYPGTKEGLSTEYERFQKKHKNWKELIPLLLPALRNQIEQRKKLNSNDDFVPHWKHLKTWINNHCWETEINIAEDKPASQGVMGEEAKERRNTETREYYQQEGIEIPPEVL